jgi:hypothetical protein
MAVGYSQFSQLLLKCFCKLQVELLRQSSKAKFTIRKELHSDLESIPVQECSRIYVVASPWQYVVLCTFLE